MGFSKGYGYVVSAGLENSRRCAHLLIIWFVAAGFPGWLLARRKSKTESLNLPYINPLKKVRTMIYVIIEAFTVPGPWFPEIRTMRLSS